MDRSGRISANLKQWNRKEGCVGEEIYVDGSKVASVRQRFVRKPGEVKQIEICVVEMDPEQGEKKGKELLIGSLASEVRRALGIIDPAPVGSLPPKGLMERARQSRVISDQR